MTKILRTLSAAAIVAAAAPAAAQTLLLDLPATSIPLAATLDNPCTLQPEAIALSGTTTITQRVWLMPDGNLRLQFVEITALEGTDALAVVDPLVPATKYVVAGRSGKDVEFNPISLSLLEYKKVAGTVDNFHGVLVLDFDPANLQLQLKVEAQCDDGLP